MKEITSGRRSPELPSFLSLLPARRDERRFAFAIMLVSLAVFVALIPFAKLQLARLDAFIPLYQSALIINDLITAVLLFGQFSIIRTRGVLILASAYLFTTLMVVAHTLSFPGLFAPTGLLGAGPQTTAWIYMFWHGGFPLLVIGYACFRKDATVTGKTHHGILLAIAATAVAAGGLVLLSTAGQSLLPSIMADNRYTPVMSGVITTVWLLSVAALVILVRRRPLSSLDLWLIVVVGAWLLDVALSAMFNAGRFDLGFYAGRIYGLMAASAVLLVLLLETRALYAHYVLNLQTANRALQQSEERLRQLNDTLEQRVQERSRQLEAEIAGREKMQATLRETQKLEAVGRMAGGIAHDFNNLLAIVIGNVEILQDRLHEKADLAPLEAIDHAVSRGISLIRQLMSFSRRQSVKVVAIDLESHFKDLSGLLEQSMRGDIRLVVDFPASVWPIQCDRDEFDLALMNLCINARDAMPRGGLVRIEAHNAILAAVQDPGLGLSGHYVAIKISDTGSGIAPENLEKVFEPFFTTKDVDKGTGLGLSQVHGFVKQAGGNITLSSPPGQGLTVTLYLPRATAFTAEALPPKPNVIQQARGRILLVEDDDDVAAVAVRILGLIGYECRRVRDAGTTLALLLGGQSFDLLFSDIVMPGGMSGLELAKKVRSHLPAMPILLCTGLSTAAAEADREGFSVIAKPYRAEVLADAIAQTIAASQRASRNSA